MCFMCMCTLVCVCNVAFEKQNKKQFQCNDSIGIENLCPENFQQQKNKRQAFTWTKFNLKIAASFSDKKQWFFKHVFKVNGVGEIDGK